MRSRWLAVLVFVAAVAVVSAQQPPQVFRAGVDVVLLDVSVTRDGAPVRGLTAADFTVLDNGAAQDVESASLDELPLDVQLVLDVSGSVRGDRHEHLIAASNMLLTSVRPADRVGLLTFSDVLLVRAGMTGDFAAVRRALGGIVPSGQTALRDALQFGFAMDRDSERRPLVLLFTDGVDTSSWLSEEEILESARRAGIVVHVVRVSGRELSSFLERLTKATGGRAWSANSDRDMDSLFKKALDEMRARYLLTFSPRGTTRPGWHELNVKVKNGKGEVVARPGYFVNR